MAAFKIWLEKIMGSAGIDATPTDTAQATNSRVANYFTKAPTGPDDLSTLTQAGDNNGALNRVVPDIAANIGQFSGQKAKRNRIGPTDIMPQIGREVWGNKQPTFFRNLRTALMRKRMQK